MSRRAPTRNEIYYYCTAIIGNQNGKFGKGLRIAPVPWCNDQHANMEYFQNKVLN